MERFFNTLNKNWIYLVLLVIVLAAYSADFIISRHIDSFTEQKEQAEALKPATLQLEEDLPGEQELTGLILPGDPYALGYGFFALVLMLAVLAGLGLDVFYLAGALSFQPPPASAKQTLGLPRHLIDVFRFIIVYMFFGLIISVVWGALSGYFRFPEDDKTALLIVSLIVNYLLAGGILIYFISIKYKQTIASIGIKVKNILSGILIGLKSYLAFLPALVAVIIAATIISEYINYPPESNPAMDIMLAENRASYIILMAFIVCVIGPIVEEIVFRGFFYNGLKKTFGFKWAIFISAAFFASLHQLVVGFFPLFALGILLAYLYEKNKSLIPSITVHIIHNSIITVLFLLLKGLSK